MGAVASLMSPSTVLSADNLPNQLFVEGAGSVRANGKFLLRTDHFPKKSSSSSNIDNASGCNRSVWFSKDDDEGCWMGCTGGHQRSGDGDPDQRKWVICMSEEILYMSPITGEKITPRQGRWELGGGGAAPAPTVNLQPLPAAFRVSGWECHHDILNGEYLPLDDGSKLLNQRPIFKHTPIAGVLVHQDKWCIYWSYGAWRVGNEDQLQSNQTRCMAFAESDATHPTAMPAEVVWKGTASEYDCGKDQNEFEVVEGVRLATGMSAQIHVSPIDGDVLTSITVRPWFDTVEDLQSQVFATDTPSQRQQLSLDGKRLKGDGRVLAQHGVVAECTIQLVGVRVILDKNELLDGLFDESVTIGDIDVVGDPSPGNIQMAFYGGHYNSADGCIYMAPKNATRAARFDPATKTWESFGDTFSESEFLINDKWAGAAVSSIDNCMYQFPTVLSKVHRMLKIDPANSTAAEVGEDVRPLAGVKEWAWFDAVANVDGCIFGVPCYATSVIRFDPRTTELSTFGQLEDTGRHKYWGGVLGPSGRYIFCMPALASRVLCIDTQDLTLDLIGPDFGRGDDNCYMDHSKYLLGALGGDNCIYCLGMNNRRILRIDPASMKVSLFGPDLLRLSGGEFFPWCGVATGMDGCLYAAPYTADRVLRIDPFAGTVYTVGEAVPSDQLMTLMSGVVDRDGAIWMLPNHSSVRMLRLAPRRPQTPLLATLLQPEQHTVLREGLRDLRCYGPALAVALWREAVRTGGDCTLVCGLLEAAATVLPTVVTASIEKDNGSTACMLLRTILAVFSPQEQVTLPESKVEMQKRSVITGGNVVSYASAATAVVQKKDDCLPPYNAIRALVTDRNVLPQCFAFSDELRGMLLRMIYGALSLEDSAALPPRPLASKTSGPPSSRVKPVAKPAAKSVISVQRAIARHLETEWPYPAAALRAIRRAPPALSTNARHRLAFLSHLTAASAILQAPAPNAWRPLPASPDEWSWPPAPLVALNAAAKLAQRLGPDTVRAMWAVLADAIASVLVRMVDAVRAKSVHASDLLTIIFDRERKSSLDTYQKQLRRVRRDPTFPEFTATAADLTKQLETLNRKEHRVQTTASFPELYSIANAMHTRFDDFLAQLAHKCAGAKALQAPLKGIGRALEKLVLRPGAAAKVRTEGLDAVDATPLVDILRGSVECPDFIEIVFILELLELLDVDMGDPKKAKAQGWDLKNFQIRIIHLKNRFTTPTSGGWADALVNFTFANDETQHVMELQIQHAQMLVVRKQGKAHDRYNSFRSAFELLEAVGCEPNDSFEDLHEDWSTPLQRLEQRIMQQNEARIQQQMQQHQAQIVKLVAGMQQHQAQIVKLVTGMQQQIDTLKTENEILRSRIKN